MKITLDIDGDSFSSESEDILDALTNILIEAGEMEDDLFLTATSAEESAILNLSN
jgi:hypothetical protein